MSDNNVTLLKQPGEFATDSLTELLKEGAQRLLATAIEAEVEGLLAHHQDKRLPDGKPALVRNGYLPKRSVQTGLGGVSVQVPKVRDRSGTGIKFNSSLIPPYLKRTQRMEAYIPWLYLRGISTGDFQSSLSVLFGEQAKGLSSNTVSQLKKAWEAEYTRWSKRDLSLKDYLYIWADGVYFSVRSDDAKQCMLVIIGVLPNGKKEVLALEDGYRESEQSWYEVLLDLQQRGLTKPPRLGIGDGALGFWQALSRVYPTTAQQRCWQHKMVNVLNKLPKSIQPKVKTHLQAIWMAETKQAAELAYEVIIGKFADKYPKAMDCLQKDKTQLLAFYDFPAAHWQHIRTTNVIESMFATVRHRTTRTKNCGSRTTNLAMVFKLAQCAQQSWRKIRCAQHLAEIVQGVQFVDGVKQENEENRYVA